MVEVTKRFRGGVLLDKEFQVMAMKTLPALVSQWKEVTAAIAY